MPFYEYNKRQEELQRILHIKYGGVKERALRRFIEAERRILQNLQISLGSTVILNSANRHLATLITQEEEPVIAFDFHSLI
jgi:nitrate/nitrite-specific signal transduction histidine kinase